MKVARAGTIEQTGGQVVKSRQRGRRFPLELNHYASEYNTEYATGEDPDHLAFGADDSARVG